MRKDHFPEASQLVGLCAYLAGKQFHFGGYSSIQPKSASPCSVWLCAKEMENHVCQNMDKIHNSRCQNTSTKLHKCDFLVQSPKVFPTDFGDLTLAGLAFDHRIHSTGMSPHFARLGGQNSPLSPRIVGQFRAMP